ncbi:hypothetical protein [Salisediminibacterium selenitireducens]|uniref:hypothetical protein n=1 Tax=Salisediminibacterium selenitireducens TaxID=85683 RepID=UPI000305B884|nr:hypothetical protein [Salisediminibacterium selenitireducens]
MEIKVIDEANKEDIQLPNEAFPLFGKLVPTLVNGQWGYSEELFEDHDVTSMSFRMSSTFFLK